MAELNQQKPNENAKQTILIIEDDPINARVFAKILSKRGGFSVCHTEDPEDMLQLAEAGAVDCISMDVSLSHSVYRGKAVDGIKLTQLLKANSGTCNIPVILVTAHAMEGDRENFLKQSGADGYISKPVVDHNQFCEQIRAVIGENHQFKSNLEQLLEFRNLVLIYAQVTHSLRQKTWGLERSIYELNEEIRTLKEKQVIEQEINQVEKPAKTKKTDKIYKDKLKAICGSIAHSLRGEFLNIGYSVKDIRELASLLPEVQEECSLIERSLEYSQIILRQLLNYLDLSKPFIEPIDIIEIINKTELMVRPRLPSNIKLEIKFGSGVRNCKALANYEQMMTIIIEFIKNATKILRNLGGIIKLNVSVIKNKIAISVIDNGPGMPMHIRRKLLKEPVSSKQGLGLGVFLCNQVVKEMGGTLNLRTSRKKGTKVTILLPIANE